MHINTHILKRSFQSFLGFFNFFKLKISVFHALNDRGAKRSFIYMTLIVVAYCFFVFNNLFVILHEFCNIIGLNYIATGCVTTTYIVMHFIFASSFVVVLFKYIDARIHALNVTYVYWRLKKYIDYFRRRRVVCGSKCIDVIKYYGMLRCYMGIKKEFELQGMKGEFCKKYKGVYLTHEIDEEARILIKEIPYFFIDDFRVRLCFIYCYFECIHGIITIGNNINVMNIHMNLQGLFRLLRGFRSYIKKSAEENFVGHFTGDTDGILFARHVANEIIGGSFDRNINESII